MNAPLQAIRLTDVATWDIEAVRRDFPGLHQQVRGLPLAYLDMCARCLRERGP